MSFLICQPLSLLGGGGTCCSNPGGVRTKPGFAPLSASSQIRGDQEKDEELWWEAGLAHIGGQEGRDAAEQVDAPAGADSS